MGSLSSSDTPSERPILIVDKEGVLGPLLLERFSAHHLTLYTSRQEPPALPQTIYIPFRRKIPLIPDHPYSHLFVVYNGEKELLQALPSFLKKTQDSGGKCILLVPLFFFEDRALTTHLARYPQLQVVIVGDMFGERSFPQSPVQSLLNDATLTGTAQLGGTGLSPLYPVAVEDVVEGIIAISMGTPVPGTFALFPKHPLTSLSFVRLLQKAYPLLGVTFIQHGEHAPAYHLPDDLIYVFSSSYPLEARLRKLDLRHTPLASMRHRKKRRTKSRKFSAPQRSRLIFVSLVLFLLSLPMLLSAGLSILSGSLLLSAQHSLEKGEIAKATQTATVASAFFAVADEATGVLQQGGSLVGMESLLEEYASTVHTGRLISDAVEEGLHGLVLVSGVTTGKSITPEEDFTKGLNKGREALRVIQRLTAENLLPERYQEKFLTWQPTIEMVVNTMDTYPQLLGMEKKQTYLVLFQNNYELRPTGGFIGSYGLVSLEKGRVTSFTIHDVYDADGQLKEKIVPPFALSRHMGASNWFLRDSNYYLDFPTSAATAANFLKLETGEVVDGVIAIDVTFLASLLDATGPLSLPDYQETITKENFYLVTQAYAEKDFFPGSTQKKDFLSALRASLEQRLVSGEGISYPTLVTALTQAVSEKHLLFAFADPQVQKLFTVNRMSGSMWDEREEGRTVVNDFLSVNEANIGLNKGNYYIKREIAQTVSIDGEGKVSGEVELSYHNTSNAQSEFGGLYKSYLRIILPEEVTLSELLFDGREQEIVPAVTDRNRYAQDGFIPPRGVEVEEITEDGKKVFGLLLTVPEQGRKVVTISYTLSKRAAVDQATFSYDLLVLKQPGTLSDPYRLEVNYPIAVRLVSSSLNVSDLGGKLIVESPLKTDQHLRLEFAKQ